MMLKPFQTIGLAKECESPENPDELEKRVALIPSDVKKLMDFGATVYVETGVGEGLGFSDDAYAAVGAQIQNTDDLYGDKDLIIKLKGLSMTSIPLMRPGCTLLCMAHFHSFPERARALKAHKINVIAMEDILESPKVLSIERVLSKVSMRTLLDPYQEKNSLHKLDIRFIGWSRRMMGAIQRAGNRNTNSLSILSVDTTRDELDTFGPNAIYYYDSHDFDDSNHILSLLEDKQCVLFDLKEFEDTQGQKAVQHFYDTHPPLSFGMRRIQCLHETGQAGARYGMKLLTELTKKKQAAKEVNAVVLGYGNVAMGAIQECYDQGVRETHILTRLNTQKDRIEKWLGESDLIINGATVEEEHRGTKYLITKEHVKSVIQPGSVIIDLIGGSQTNRSPVESVLECTFLTNPYFIENGVTLSALWGWPMMGMMRESAICYSRQIVDVLLGKEKLINGLSSLAPGVKIALVCGTF